MRFCAGTGWWISTTLRSSITHSSTALISIIFTCRTLSATVHVTHSEGLSMKQLLACENQINYVYLLCCLRMCIFVLVCLLWIFIVLFNSQSPFQIPNLMTLSHDDQMQRACIAGKSLSQSPASSTSTKKDLSSLVDFETDSFAASDF